MATDKAAPESAGDRPHPVVGWGLILLGLLQCSRAATQQPHDVYRVVAGMLLGGGWVVLGTAGLLPMGGARRCALGGAAAVSIGLAALLVYELAT